MRKPAATKPAKRVKPKAVTKPAEPAMDVAVGDEVLFAKYGGTEFKLEDEELLILPEKDILAIVEG